MKLPFTFKEFVTKPFAAIAILCICGMGYLYVDARSANNAVIEACQSNDMVKTERITKLEKDVSDLQTKIVELAMIHNRN